MDIQEVADLAQQLGTPIDFQRLERDGVLKKAGKAGSRQRYEILNFSNLPKYASRQIEALEVSDVKKGGQKFVATFTPRTANARAQKSYEKLTCEEFKPLD